MIENELEAAKESNKKRTVFHHQFQGMMFNYDVARESKLSFKASKIQTPFPAQLSAF